MIDPTISIPSEIPEVIKWVITAIVIPFLGFLSSKITKIDDKMVDLDSKIQLVDGKVDKVNTTLIGQDGKNGLRSRVVRMESRVENIALAIASRGIGVRVVGSSEEKDDA